MRRDEIMIRYRTERGISTLLLILGAFLLTRSWWSGELAQWIGLLFQSFKGDDAPQFAMKSQDGMMSVSYAIVSIVGDLIYGIVLVATWVLTDIRNGFNMWWESRFPNDEPEPQIVQSVTAPAPKPLTQMDVLIAIQNGMVGLQTQIDELAAKSAAPKATRTRKASNDTV